MVEDFQQEWPGHRVKSSHDVNLKEERGLLPQVQQLGQI
jgi:hypothetical protein